jgi:hypothetical protein
MVDMAVFRINEQSKRSGRNVYILLQLNGGCSLRPNLSLLGTVHVIACTIMKALLSVC